jgi:hypothetical protein
MQMKKWDSDLVWVMFKVRIRSATENDTTRKEQEEDARG